jgi:hypothetical protein
VAERTAAARRTGKVANASTIAARVTDPRPASDGLVAMLHLRMTTGPLPAT